MNALYIVMKCKMTGAEHGTPWVPHEQLLSSETRSGVHTWTTGQVCGWRDVCRGSTTAVPKDQAALHQQPMPFLTVQSSGETKESFSVPSNACLATCARLWRHWCVRMGLTCAP
jgi:hypothetical protein